jgi:multiple sugar transport system substrate-binding protein
MKGKKIVSMALTAVMIVPLLAACSFGGNKSEKETQRVLRIATSDGFTDDEWFRQQYTDIFEFNNPNIEIEIIPTGDESERFRYYGNNDGSDQKEYKDPFVKMQELMEGDNPPDIVMMNYDQMAEMLEKNLLTPLDSKIAEDKFDVTDYVPVVYDGIKSLSPDGKIYALAPLFNSSALIYNKKIFADAGVEPPTDNMTWDDVFALASRVSKPDAEKPIYGFSFTTHQWRDPFYEMSIYAGPLGIRYFDDAAEKMTVDTDEWEKVWNKMYELQQQKAIPPVLDPNDPKAYQERPEDQGPFSQDSFMMGRLGMTIMGYGQLREIMDANQHADNIKNYTPIDWDVVTMPSHPEHPGVVSNVYISGLMGINAKATNADDAWKFIQFLNSPEWAKLKSGSSYQMPARKSFIKPKDGQEFHIEAFYNIKPSSFSENDYYKLYRQKPNLHMAVEPGMNMIREVMLGKKKAREGLKTWQEQGDKVLQQIKANPNGPIDMNQITGTGTP